MFLVGSVLGSMTVFVGKQEGHLTYKNPLHNQSFSQSVNKNISNVHSSQAQAESLGSDVPWVA